MPGLKCSVGFEDREIWPFNPYVLYLPGFIEKGNYAKVIGPH